MIAAGRARPERGFSLVELLIASMLMLTVLAGVIALVRPVGAIARREPAALDLEQRVRASFAALARDLSAAGAGPAQGPRSGPLGYHFAPVWPYGVGTVARGSPAAPDGSVVTVLFVPSTAATTVLAAPLSNPSAATIDAVAAGCPVADPSCGFQLLMRVAVYTDAAMAVYTVANVQGATLQLQPRDGGFSPSMRAGSSITEVVSRTFFFDAAQRRVSVYDGYRSTTPLVDDVVAMQVEYWGDPYPPMLVRPLSDPIGPWTTYGPRPPADGVDDPVDDWPAGENCVFARVSGAVVPRLPAMAGASPGRLVPLPLALFADGPWCGAAGQGAAAPAYDADLLRIRKVGVTMRLQVDRDDLRGGNPRGLRLFANPGSSRDAHALVPDREIRFEISPPDMNLGRQ